MADKLTKNIKATIGGPETTAGTAVSREYVIPLAGVPSLRAAAEKAEDPVIVGANMTRGMFTMAKNAGGSLPLSPRCCGGMGQLLNGLLGQESSPTQIAACIRVRYTGDEDSAKISASASGDTLTSEVGDLGSESGDTNFGTSGDIDLTAASTDTVGELVSVINAYDDYDCEKVFGSDSIDAADIVEITAGQAASRWVYVWFSSSSSGYYRHTWPVVLTNTDRPVYSVQLDGMHDNYLYDGVMVNAMTLSAALKGMMDGSAEVLGFEETGSQSASALSIEDVKPLIFSQGSLSLGEYEFTYTRNVEINLTNNADPEGYGMGSLWRQYHRKTNFGTSGRMAIRYDANVYGFRSGMFNDAVVGLSFYFKANTDFDSTNDIPQIILVEVPYAQLTVHQEQENNGVLDVSLEFTATNPDNEHSDPITVSMITDDSGAY